MIRLTWLLLAASLVAANAQIETPGSGAGGGGGGGGTSTPYYGPFTNTQIYGTTTNALRISSSASNIGLHVLPAAASATGIVVKAAASQTADLLRFENSSGSAQLQIRKDGAIEYGDNSVISYVGSYSVVRWGQAIQSFAGAIGLSPINSAGSASLVRMERDSDNVLQLGADAATATAQTIKAHDGSGSDKAGGSLTLAGGQNTGVGLGGALITKTSLPGSGSVLGNLGTRHYAYAGHKAMVDNVNADLFDVSVPTGKYASIRILVSIRANDGFGGWAAGTIERNITAYNDAGTVEIGASAETQSMVHAFVGTSTIGTGAAATGGNAIRVHAFLISDGWAETPTAIYARWQIWINSDDVATVTPL